MTKNGYRPDEPYIPIGEALTRIQNLGGRVTRQTIYRAVDARKINRLLDMNSVWVSWPGCKEYFDIAEGPEQSAGKNNTGVTEIVKTGASSGIRQPTNPLRASALEKTQPTPEKTFALKQDQSPTFPTSDGTKERVTKKIKASTGPAGTNQANYVLLPTFEKAVSPTVGKVIIYAYLIQNSQLTLRISHKGPFPISHISINGENFSAPNGRLYQSDKNGQPPMPS